MGTSSRGLVRLLVLGLSAAIAGCRADAGAILREVRTIRELGGDEANAKIRSVVEQLGQSEESATEAYMKASSPEDRRMLLFCLNLARKKTYVPLLCYAARFAPTSGERCEAMTALGHRGRIEAPFTNSSVVAVLGECLANASTAQEAEYASAAVTLFCGNACNYRIEGLMGDTEASKAAFVDRTRSWWQKTGSVMAKEGAFDTHGPSSQVGHPPAR